ncbi:MAG: 30S ribosomal protein S20 [Candidatus Magasanikbacteria bacterium CG11_big_fil_rev_8_21_14_0_20_39_34]|uniref:Small ribosomal subunit protein bS20 n=1 Tax=Candidatus Magasanikbacteria bacterium CG11_big_fil_rev_8_21_14_0_20_39_34 TaxID=1974653 RepID=A0A2H0N6M1_9BACT|nr:MAG: 30S ribosomal protein S20 [Candidatus Magasanikbacteria bacterium CG11_big_fil_rev_8_21_14_0_20_39_34]
MPNLRNAKKALRQAEKRTKQNLVVKKAYKGAVKQMTKALDAGEKDIQKTLQMVQKKLGKAAKKGVLTKNTAARKLSRLAKKANKVAKK